ncbi:vesicle-trafficking protein SEC22b-B-like [Pantherophis guttatus]|uniref:Vesicle-trafficking protein SEC22b-B-like n=1 Tax=Pantherophis guttatus TaxID=94885 RepID=A0A6P9CD93_PANGU|nr:vesicle-trafficking protein SEC22b-B-like [Pantherophis guttatus]
MVLLTMISRVQDGLLLAASMQESEQSNRNFQEYHNQAKQLFRKLGAHSPNRCSLQAGTMTFHYLISQGICYLTLCEANYSKKLAFAFLEELQTEFWELYGKKISSVSRPYAFIEFDIYIQKLKKTYLDTWSKRHLSSINTELQDVQKIMVTNIEEVLQRGETLSALDSKASNLSTLSKKYRHDAKLLNSRSAYAKAAATGLIFMVLLLYIRFWWLV